jgi:hypothetical protein
MHADALVALSDCRQQRGNPEVSLLTHGMQCHGAVFAAAPAKKHRGNFFGRFLLGFFVFYAILASHIAMPRNKGDRPYNL